MFKATRREICSVLSAGTRTYGYMDSMSHNYAENSETTHRDWLAEVRWQPPTTTVLLAIKEVPVTRCAEQSENENEAEVEPVACAYGVCLVDCPTASIMLGQFQDDAQRTRLRTLLTQVF